MLALGDITERLLRFFGITKERVQAVTGLEDCGCEKRQAAMNRLGYRWQYRLMLPYYWLQEKWQRMGYWEAATRARVAGRYMKMAFRVLFFGR
jgi:hypothetical protein